MFVSDMITSLKAEPTDAFSTGPVQYTTGVSDGTIETLTGLKVDCGYAALIGFQLLVSDTGDIKYAYYCDKSGAPTYDEQSTNTAFVSNAVGKSVRELSKFNIDCGVFGVNYILDSFTMREQDDTDLAYGYTCSSYEDAIVTCSTFYTSLANPTPSDYSVETLAEHEVLCYDGSALSQFQYQRTDGEIRYTYQCCTKSLVPTTAPSQEPTVEPTANPSQEPTLKPSEGPTLFPTQPPSKLPTLEPTARPSKEPTLKPSKEPTKEPTPKPIAHPTMKPTREPSTEPTHKPIAWPTLSPTLEPTKEPSKSPSAEPSIEPTVAPSYEPTKHPYAVPTLEPTHEPSMEPTLSPTPEPTLEPTHRPSKVPSEKPTREPSEAPSLRPSFEPTEEPTRRPISVPTYHPTRLPTEEPTHQPTMEPSRPPTLEPSFEPTLRPSAEPTEEPIDSPTAEPTMKPSPDPSSKPTKQPSMMPTTAGPSESPTMVPTYEPTAEQTREPIFAPTFEPSSHGLTQVEVESYNLPRYCPFTYLKGHTELDIPAGCAFFSNRNIDVMSDEETSESLIICTSSELGNLHAGFDTLEKFQLIKKDQSRIKREISYMYPGHSTVIPFYAGEFTELINVYTHRYHPSLAPEISAKVHSVVVSTAVSAKDVVVPSVCGDSADSVMEEAASGDRMKLMKAHAKLLEENARSKYIRNIGNMIVATNKGHQRR